MYLFLLGYHVSLVLEILCGHSSVTLHAFVNRFSWRYFSIFQVNIISALVTLEFSLSHAFVDKIAGEGGGGGGGGGGGEEISFFFLPSLSPLFLSACRMERGQEETSVSQPGHKRGPT